VTYVFISEEKVDSPASMSSFFERQVNSASNTGNDAYFAGQKLPT
jgi:hypothetical protein